VYTDAHVIQLVGESFIPVRVHVKEHADEFKRLAKLYSAQWTPTILTIAPDGTERHRIEGFLPADDFLPQLKLGLAKLAFSNNQFDDAARLFAEVVSAHAASDVAAEALYWTGVAKYKSTGDASALSDTAREFGSRYTDSAWAKKASVWSA